MDLESKKKITFLCYSPVDLTGYYDILSKHADCWWIVWNPYVRDELIAKGYNKIIFKKIPWGGWKDGIIFKALSWFSEIPRVKEFLFNNLVNSIKSDLIISDTVLTLKGCKVSASKILVFHSVCYKKYIMSLDNLELFDFLFLPSDYHRLEIMKRFGKKWEDKLKVVGWPRADKLLELNSANDISIESKLSSINLDPTKKTLMYAPTWNSFDNGKMFPELFGEDVDAFEQLAIRCNELNLNLIIRLHPFMAKLIESKELQVIAEKHSVLWGIDQHRGYIEDGGQELLLLTDYLISDVSGIISEFMMLDKPIIFIEPDADGFRWSESDLTENLRPGMVTKTLDELLLAIETSIKYPEEYSLARKEIVNKIFYKLDGSATSRACDTILTLSEERF